MDQDTKQEFEILTKIIKESFEGLDNRIDGLENRIDGLENRLNKRIDGLENKLENIELRLDNTAYSFEVKELDKRLVKVERKLGLET